jgi:hypothetical protein
MAKIGRNEPCPCGSGKKYKKCCLGKDQAVVVSAAHLDGGFNIWDDDGLDELSNSVVDLLKADDLDGAEAACAELKQRFPDLIDWLDRTAMLHEAKGNTDLAIEYYERCLAFIAQQPDGFETGPMYEDSIKRLRSDPTAAPPWRPA